MLSSFVIGFHTNRIDNLLQTLRFLISDHAEVTSKSQLVAVCQDSMTVLPDDLLKEFVEIKAGFANANHFDLSLSEMSLPYVTNFGVDKTLSQKLIILESDRILPKGYFAEVLEQLGPNKCISCTDMRKLQKPATDENIRNNSYEFLEEKRCISNEIGIRNWWSGNTAVWKDDYYRVGKMDEAYIGYGWADTDMGCTFEKAGIENIARTEIELHLWHPPVTYGERNQKHLFLNNGVYFCEKWDYVKPPWLLKEISEFRRSLML